MAQNDAIKTGVEHDSDADTDADIYAFNDDGEYATLFAITRISDTKVEIEYHRCEAGLIEHDTTETFPIDADKSTEEFARECAEANPEESIKATRDYWN